MTGDSLKYPLTEDEKKLVEQYHNLIYTVMRDYRLSHNEKSDMYGIAALALMVAARTYTTNPKCKNLRFTTVAYNLVSGALWRERERAHKYKALSLDVETEDGTPFYNCVPYTIPECNNSPKTIRTYQNIKKLLTKKQFEALQMVAGGFTLCRAAELLGCGYSTFQSRYYQAKAKVIQHMDLLEVGEEMQA